MEEPPQVSIVLPVRNAARTLPAALESIRAQTLRAWELVAVDDGSRDETARQLRDAARADADAGQLAASGPDPAAPGRAGRALRPGMMAVTIS